MKKVNIGKYNRLSVAELVNEYYKGCVFTVEDGKITKVEKIVRKNEE